MIRKSAQEKENTRSMATSVPLRDERQSTIQSEQQPLLETTNLNDPPAEANDECTSNLWPKSNGEQDILDFLLSINRTLGYLFDRFVSAGIQSKAQLLVAAQWPQEERDVFFRTEVRL
ncbi:hypothetical protein V8D89_013619, partial [Ganoderma adspersum]